MAGVALPIATELLQVLIADSGPPLFPHIVTHIRGNLTLKQQRPSGKILIGGAWKGEGNRETGVKRIRRESLLGNLRWASETIPAVARTRVMRGWVGFEGRSPDKLLMCGPVGSPAGFHVLGVAAGGFTLSPVAGLIAAEYIATGHTTVHCEPFHVRRFLGAAAARPPLPNEPAAARQLPNPQPRGAR
jgi:glycine/D-amino acid oxidase-like deaminating enzyme